MLNHNVYGEPTTADNYLMDTRPNNKWTMGNIRVSPLINGKRFWSSTILAYWYLGDPRNWLDTEITSSSYNGRVLILQGTFYPVYLNNKRYSLDTSEGTVLSEEVNPDYVDPVINKLMEDDFTNAEITTTTTYYVKISFNDTFRYFTGLGSSGGHISADTAYEMNVNPVPSNAKITVTDSRTATLPTLGDDTVSIANDGDGSRHVLRAISSNGFQTCSIATFPVDKSWAPDTDGIQIQSGSATATSEGTLTFESITAKTSEIIRG